MTVAELFPARRQPDGAVWYRAAGHDGTSLDMGWTTDLAQAHPDYRAADEPEPLLWPADLLYRPLDEQEVEIMASAIGEKFDATELYPPTTTEEIPMTALTADFEEYEPPRETQWMRYPLPPAPPRAKVKFGAWGWYQLPSPSTGRPTGYPRATTIADTLDDQYGLSRWKRRETATRVLDLALMDPATQLHSGYETTAGDALKALLDAQAGKVTAIDDVLDTIDNLMGGAEARELGECVHAWLEALCLGMVLLKDVPDIVHPHIEAALKVMAHRGIVSRPEYVERIVLNDQGDETVVGRIDCIWELVDSGDLVLGDIKTNKDLKYSWLTYGVQVGGCYGWATKMLTVDGKRWELMPDIRKDYAILLHIPSNEPEKAAAITIDMWWGGTVMAESLATRTRRKEAKNEVPKHALPAPSDRALRIVKARIALMSITSLDEGQAVYETYQDVWDDDLGEFAATVAELL